MSHPEELLADYVDGTLATDQRAVVDAHLASCATCREEVDLARGALTALASLPDEPVPFGVTGPVLAEAGRRFERRRTAMWGRLQWAAGLGAAAALVVVVALNVGGGSERENTGAFGSATAADGQVEAAAPEDQQGQALASAFRGLEEQEGVNFDDAGIRALARDAVPILAGRAVPVSGGVTSERAADEALACIAKSGAPTVDDPRDTLIRLIAAEYSGTPAYIAVYAEGPGAGQPADRVVIWAVDRRTCGILTTAYLPVRSPGG